MMKKKRILLIGLFCMLFPLKICALTGSVNLNCSSTNVIVNNTLNCTITGNTNAEVSALSAKLTASGNITITNIITASIWQGDGKNGVIELYTDSNKKGTFQIATFTIKASGTPGTGQINLNNIKFSDSEFIENNISSKTLTINVKNVEKPTPSKSNNATLKSLTVNGEKINLSNNKYEYSINVKNEITNISLNVQTNNSKAKVTLPENLDLKEGTNEFNIKVTAEDGTIKTYKLKVTRLERELSNNSKLSELLIDNNSISFDSNKFEYDLGDIDESQLVVNATAEDSVAKVEIFGDKNIGKNDVVVIKVTAENGSSSEYLLYANNKSISEYNCEKVKCKKSTIPIYLYIVIFILLLLLIITNIKKKHSQM